MNSVVRRFVFTLNNYSEEQYVRAIDFLQHYCKYGVVGKETGESGTPHLQGFCNLKKQMRFNTIKAKLDNAIHLEKANHNDLAALVDAIQSGQRDIRTIAEAFPTSYIRYHRGIKEYLKTTCPINPRTFKTFVYYYWGPTGTGKSRRSLMEATSIEGGIYYKPRGEWWDGYHQQDNVIIDDFYGWIKWDELLKICDRYPYKVPVKGGYEEFTSRRIWITSNVDTDMLYKFTNYDPAPFERRITNKVHM
ncbi:putative spliced replication-associated protein [Cyclovirus roach]|uniref:Replication-associated protein n=1 Tax=Cyclovirus roach TaxID=3052164 RepID=L7WSA3_9CIRC|nr:putative spliced replication-associated protein [Cyclovirus roach]AGC84157.1 putative spliced replication-associated protein [Cyclovirus roach]